MRSSGIAKTEKRLELPLVDRTALALLFVFLVFEVLGGAVRYWAVHFGLPWLPYVPHLLVALAIVPLVILRLASEGITSAHLMILLLFGLGTAYGVLNLASPRQVEFGLWVLLVFLYGVFVLPSIVWGWARLRRYVLWLWVLALVGVLLNFVYTWPWTGFEYQIGGTSIEASRLWQIGALNLARLPGFSRASFDAAFQILALALLLKETLQGWRWVAMWVLSGVALLLTTDKSAIAMFMIFSFLPPFRSGRIRRGWRAIPVALACLDIVVPFSMLYIRIDWLRLIKSPVWVALVASFVDRLQTWPDWIRMVIEKGSPFLGRGVGGIGVAQWYFEPSVFSPADNIAVYLYGTFGLLGLVLLLLYGWKASRLIARDGVGHFFFLCACFVLLEGATVNVLESSFTALAFGASYRYLQDGSWDTLRIAAAQRLRMSAGSRLPRESTEPMAG